MDKEKVKGLMDEISNKLMYVTAIGDTAFFAKRKIEKLILEVKKELSKSDWISVDEELPPYDEEVLVRDINAKGAWSKPWICYRSKEECYKNITDKHKFVTTRLDEITHWQHIEK